MLGSKDGASVCGKPSTAPAMPCISVVFNHWHQTDRVSAGVPLSVPLISTKKKFVIWVPLIGVAKILCPATGGDTASPFPGAGPTFSAEASSSPWQTQQSVSEPEVLAVKLFVHFPDRIWIVPTFHCTFHLRFLDPISVCLVPVTGSVEGLKPRRLCPLRLFHRGVNRSLLRTLPPAP